MKSSAVPSIFSFLRCNIGCTGPMTFIFLASFYAAKAQVIQNVKASFASGKVTVSYDIMQADPTEEFELTLFSSHNNFSTSLKLVHGDVGKNIKPGTGKRIEWDAMAELGTFKGEITFRVKGEPVFKNISFIDPIAGKGMRRGKTSTLKWEGGNPRQTIKIELYKGTQRISTIANTKNNGQYVWAVPIDMEKGNDYSLKATMGQHKSETGTFSIQSKIPLFLKIAPAVVAGAVILLLPRDPDKPRNLPEPPDPQ